MAESLPNSVISYSNNENLKENAFLIKKYARLANPAPAEDATSSDETLITPISKEQWIYEDGTPEDPIILFINKESMFLLMKGNLVLENFSLISANGNLRIIAKGDSILAVCKAQDFNGKFRLQFSEERGQSGIERCQRCLRLLCSYVQIKNTNSQANNDGADLTTPGTGADLTTPGNVQTAAVSGPTARTTPGLYERVNRATLDEEIFRCLLDPNFAELVNRVEKCMLELS